MIGIWILLGTIITLFLSIGYIYNSLIRVRNQLKNFWVQVNVQLRRRHDIVGKLSEIAKNYMANEVQALDNIVKLKNQAVEVQSLDDKAKAESALASAVNEFLLVSQRYPELKSNESFCNLREEFTSTENRIAFTRQAYNDKVVLFNNKIQMFPSNIIANTFHFKEREFFKI